MIVLLHHRTLLVAAVQPILGEPVLQGAEHLQAPSRQALPDIEQPGLDAVLRLRELQAEVDVVLQQLLAVLLPAPARSGIDGALHPLAARADRGGMHRRFGLAAIMLAPEIDRVGVAIVRAPHRRRAVPADIEAVAARPVQRDLERLDHDLRFRHRIDRPAAELRYALGPRVALVGWDRAPQLRLLLGRQMRDFVPGGADHELAHVVVLSDSRNDITTSLMPSSGVKVTGTFSRLMTLIVVGYSQHSLWNTD